MVLSVVKKIRLTKNIHGQKLYYVLLSRIDKNKTFDFTVHTVWNTACLTGQSQSSYQLRYEILFIGVRWRLPSTKEAEESTKKIAMAKEGQLLLHTCRLLTHAVHKNYPELFLFFFYGFRQDQLRSATFKLKGAVSRRSSSFCLIWPITRPQSVWNLK